MSPGPKFVAAAVQMVSSDDVTENLFCAGDLIAEAAAAGASLVVLPENFAFMGRTDTDRIAHAEPDAPVPDARTPLQDFLRRQASTHGVWLVGGSLAIGHPADARVRSACLLFAPDGTRVARYDKIHLFDVDVPGTDKHYRESNSTLPGHDAVVAGTPLGNVGLAICYDLRFPELFRIMAAREVAVIALCSAFTATTGAAHWETLVRARAIENLTAVVAACQGGVHTAGRETWGHSMIVDAWGRVLARHATNAGIALAEIDLGLQAKIRTEFPALQHRKHHDG